MLGRAAAVVLRRSTRCQAFLPPRPIVRCLATAGTNSNVLSYLTKNAPPAAGAAKVLEKDQSSHQRLRAALPERKAAASALYDVPYPKNNLGEFGIYAIDLFADAKAAGEDPASVSKQLSAIQDVLTTDSDLSDMLMLPLSTARLEAKSSGATIPFMQGRKLAGGKIPVGLAATSADREARLNQLFTKLKITPPVRSFVRKLADVKGAFSKIARLQNFFDEMARYQRNEVLVTIKTVDPLSKEQMKKLQTKIGAKAAAGQKLIFREEIDPSILGGLVIFYGDKTQDLSVASRVRTLQKMLQSQPL